MTQLMQVIGNKNGRSKCRICDTHIRDERRIMTYGIIDSYGNQVRCYYHIKCVQEMIDSSNDIHIDHRTNKEIDQTTILMDLLIALLKFITKGKTGKALMMAFIKEHQELWDKAHDLSKESDEK